VSDLGAIVKDGAQDMAQGGERAGTAIVEHFEGIGTELRNAGTRYRGVESDIENNFKNVTADSAQDAEHAADQATQDAAHGASSLHGPDVPAGGSGDGLGHEDVQDDFTGGDEGGHDSEGTENSEGASDPVDVVSGQMLSTRVDIDLPGVLPLTLRRAYASGYRHGALFGPGWSSTLDQRVVVDEDGIHFLGDDAQVLNYPVPAQPEQEVLPAAGARWPLRWDRASDTIEIRDPFRGLVRKFPATRQDARDQGQDRDGDRGQDVRDLARIEDRNGNWIRFVRDADGVPTEVVHSGGYRLTVDASAVRDGLRIIGLRLADGSAAGAHVLTYGYDALGRLAEISDSTDIPFVFEYDRADRITAWVDRLGHRYEYTYDDAGRVVRGDGPEGYLSATFAYDAEARVTAVTNGNGETTAYHYDEHRHITRIVGALGHETRFEHDRFGREISRTDALGNTVRYEYDARGDLVRVSQPDGTEVLARYNALHQPVEVVDRAGAVWTYEFDDRGNLAAAADPLGARRSYTYDDRGRLASSTDASGNTTRYETDGAGLLTALIDPLGAASRTARDGFGRAVALTDPLGNVTRFGFRPEGEALWRELPDGSREEWEYDAEGNQVRHVGPAGAVTAYEYGPVALRTAEVKPDGSRYTFAYDAERNLREVADPTGLTWRYEYAPGGLLTSETDFNGRVTTYGYDPTGVLVERTNAAGQRMALTRDSLGRVLERRLGEQTAISYSYDVAGRLTRAQSPDAVLECEYDAIGRVLTESVDGRTTRYRYDADGRLVERITPSGAGSAWSYDPNGQPAALVSGAGSLSMAYDATGHETSRFVGAGAAITRTWDGNHRLLSQALWAYDAAPVSAPEAADSGSGSGSNGNYRSLAERTYEYRSDGYPVQLWQGTRGTARFILDPSGRSTAVESTQGREEYAFDAAGRLTSASWPSADQDAQDAQGERQYAGSRLVRAGRTIYEYDAQGRVIRKLRRTLSGQTREWTFAWDADDKLVEATTPDGSTWRYGYDAYNRRVSKRRLAPDGGVAEETVFAWDGTRLAEQTRRRDGGGREATTWDWEPGTDRVAAQTRRSWADDASQEEIDREFHAIVTDRVGTPTELLTADGRIAWRAETNTWGAAGPGAPPESAEQPCPLRFPGQYHDPETGLDYNYLRYYDPEAARYLSPDPLGLFPQPDDYGYTENPLVLTDPLGLAKRTPHFADITVYDPQGNVKYSYGLRSGNQLPEEAALGFPNSSMASHTEVRSMRLHGGSPTVPIANDPLANTMPVSPGDRVEINGTKPPCSQCRGAMNRAVNELGVSVNYNWGGNTWSASG
jgi:RHS repeat-associated protein